MNAIRWIGAVLLVGAGSLWGYVTAEALKRRPEQLSSFQRSLELVKSEVGYGLVALSTAWERASRQEDGPVGETFRQAALLLNTGEVESAQRAWELGLQSQVANLVLCREDLEVLRGLGPVLMLMSSQEQCRHLELICTRLRMLESAAIKHATRYAQLTLNLGILGALALTIVLL